MADETTNDYYDIIREKITDPEIQKALDAFHARGVSEQRQPRETAEQTAKGSLRDAAPPPESEGVRQPAEGGARRPSGDASYQYKSAEKITPPRSEVPRKGQEYDNRAPFRNPEAANFHRYMQTPKRQSVYPDYRPADAYDEAYRDAIRKASGRQSRQARVSRGKFVVGLFVIMFAFFGVGCAVFFCIKGVAAYQAKKNEELCASYNARLVSVAAVDPDAFDDISAARMEDLIKIAVWRLIGSGVDPNRYDYANGELCLPQADVEAAYAGCFGTQFPILHQTVEGYGYTAKYSAEDAAYYVPMTTLEPIYTPKVVSVETKGGVTVVTCGFISSGMWKQDRETGDISVPEPDKYVRITFRTASGAEYISSLQSLGLPETAIPSADAAIGQEPQTDLPSAEPPVETTTEKQIVITWD